MMVTEKIRAKCKGALRIKLWLKLIIALGVVTLPFHASAKCTRISYAAGISYPSNNDLFVDPAYGTHDIWDSPGEGDGGGADSLPGSINVNNSLVQPDGTLLASGIAPVKNLGTQVYSSPEQVLFRCDAADAGQLFEYYTTNGPFPLTGKYEDGASFGIPGAYRTRYQGVLSRVTNLQTGRYFARNWQARPLTNLTRDSQGKILVKVKDFSDVRIELIRASNETMAASEGFGGDNRPALAGTGIGGGFGFPYGITYTAFNGPGVGSGKTYVGADSNSVYPDFQKGTYVGAVRFYQSLYINRSATCAVTTVTPVVVFPGITVQELNQGVQRQQPFNIQFNCQTAAPANTGVSALSSGTGRGQTAMGLLVQPENYAAAQLVGLNTSGTGVSYLLSDSYLGSSTVARGVGVVVSRVNGTPLNFLGNEGMTLGGEADGWYPVLAEANTLESGNGTTTYISRLRATLKKIPGETPTAGKFNANVQVIIRVQ